MGFPAVRDDSDDRPRDPEPDAVRWYPEVRRSYPRYDVRWDVALQAEGSNETAPARVLNISRGGALVRSAAPLDSSLRHLIVFLEGEDDLVDRGRCCPRCGERLGVLRLQARSTWARVLRQGRGGGGWAAALEFETLLEFRESGGREQSDE